MPPAPPRSPGRPSSRRWLARCRQPKPTSRCSSASRDDGCSRPSRPTADSKRRSRTGLALSSACCTSTRPAATRPCRTTPGCSPLRASTATSGSTTSPPAGCSAPSAATAGRRSSPFSTTTRASSSPEAPRQGHRLARRYRQAHRTTRRCRGDRSSMASSTDTGALVTASDNGSVAAMGSPRPRASDPDRRALHGPGRHERRAGGGVRRRPTAPHGRRRVRPSSAPRSGTWRPTASRQRTHRYTRKLQPRRQHPRDHDRPTGSCSGMRPPEPSAARSTWDPISVASAPPAFSPDGRLLAAADADDNAIRVFDVASAQPIGEPLAVPLGVRWPEALPPRWSTRHRRRRRSRRLASSTHSPGRSRRTSTANRGGTASTETGAIGQFTPDGTEIITVGFADHRVLAWDAVTGAPHGDLLGGRNVTEGLHRLQPRRQDHRRRGPRRQLHAVGPGQRAESWPTSTPARPASIGVAWDPHRPILVTTGAPGSILFWDVTDPRHPVEQRRRALTAPAGFPCFSPDGRFLVVADAFSTTIGDRLRRRHRTQAADLRRRQHASRGLVHARQRDPGRRHRPSSTSPARWCSTTRRPGTTGRPSPFPTARTGSRSSTAAPASSHRATWPAAGSTSGTPRRSNRSASPSPSRPPTTLRHRQPRAARRSSIGSYSGITTVLDVDPHSWQRTACRLAGRNLTRTEWAQYVPGQAYRKTCPHWPAGR